MVVDLVNSEGNTTFGRIFPFKLIENNFCYLIGLGYFSEQAFEAMHSDIKVIIFIHIL